MKFVFLGIYQFFLKRRPLFYTVVAISFVLAGYFASRIRLEEDISRILPADKKIEKLNEVFQQSRFADRLVLTVYLKDSLRQEPDSLVAFTDEFVEAAGKNLKPFVSGISARVDDETTSEWFNVVQERLPVYLDENDYRQIDSLIQPERVRETLKENLRTLSSPAGIALKGTISRDPVGISFIGLRKLQQLQFDENLELYDGYLLTKDLRHLVFFITPQYPPNNTGQNALFLQGLDSLISQKISGKDISVDYFGATAVSAGNAIQLRKDAMLTQGITVFFLILFSVIYFRKKRAPLVILIPVVFGALFSLAMLYFIKGTVSVIALGTGSVILGIAVNYSLHFFNHYRHARDIPAVIGDLALPLTVGGITTIGGFLCLQFVQSEMLKDLGLFAAFSLIGAALSSLIFLPHLVRSSDYENSVPYRNISWIDRLSSYRLEYNRWLVPLIIILTVLFGLYANKAGFESDMMKMNYMKESLKKSEENFNRINAYALQSAYLVTEGRDLQQALRHNEQLQRKTSALQEQGIVVKYSGVGSLLLSDSLQKERISRWNSYWTPEKKQAIFSLLDTEGEQLGYRTAAFEGFRQLLNTDYPVTDNRDMISPGKSYLSDYISETPQKTSVVTLVKVAPGKKKDLYAAFENDPVATVVDKQYITEKIVEIINVDFSSIAWMTSILVFLVLLITYGRIELALVAFIPMLITWIWILGIMGMFDIRFNIINIIISALIFGLGDDYSLFILDGLVNEYKTGRKNLSSYKSSIVISAITTIVGLGVLIFAKHPALRSVALISIIGIASVALISQVMIPYLFSLLITRRIQKGFFPWTMTSFLLSLFSTGYYIIGALLTTLAGLILLPFQLISKERTKLIFHHIVSKYCWSVMYIMPNTRKKIINPHNEDFSRPAVIICNHQSSLDVIVTIMLHPKIILFTNKRVWNSPVIGALVRMADYFPVIKGVESSVDRVAERMRHGYSVVIFPEGTRTVDGTMKRFHKGAFYLAEQLNADILPIVIHGTSYTRTKGDFMLKNGPCTLKILPRIKPDDQTYGEGYTERAKFIGRYFRHEYRKLKEDIEKPAYFRELLKYNYIYKGPVLEWYMRIKTSLEKNYQPFHEMLPLNGKILDIGCGYGFMAYMLHFAAPGRDITGIDYDEEKIATAMHNFSRNEMLRFYHSDATTFSYGSYDAIILADILHYLQPDAQRTVLEKCISHLNPGGKIIIREGNKELKERHKGTELSEFFSTKLVRFNKTTRNGLSFLSAAFLRQIADENRMECTTIDETRYTSNMVFVLKRNNEVKHGTV